MGNGDSEWRIRKFRRECSVDKNQPVGGQSAESGAVRCGAEVVVSGLGSRDEGADVRPKLGGGASRSSDAFGGISEGGGESWAILASLINTAKLHELDPQTYLADVLERIVSGRTKTHQLHELLAWNWKAARELSARAAA